MNSHVVGLMHERQAKSCLRRHPCWWGGPLGWGFSMGRVQERGAPEKEPAPSGVMRLWAGPRLGGLSSSRPGVPGSWGQTEEPGSAVGVHGWPEAGWWKVGGSQELAATMQTDQGGWAFQANLKKFMDYIQLHSTDKVARLLDKGLDPNFHDPDSGGEMQSKEGHGRGVAGM